MIEELFLLISYMAIGGGLKYIDQAYDRRLFSKYKANIVGILIGVLAGYLVITNNNNTMILFSILIANAILRKIDNIGFYLGVIALIPVMIIFGNFIGMEWSTFGFLIAVALVDQYGDDWREARKLRKSIDTLLHYGTIWKIGILITALLGLIPWIYFFAALILDIAYSYVEIYSEKRHWGWTKKR